MAGNPRDPVGAAGSTDRTKRTKAATDRPSRSALVAVAPQTSRPGPQERASDVDEWGRSESFRRAIRRAYDPVYKHWFRVEWDGLEKIPRVGGALLISNHAGAIPSDAPVIMHGVEEIMGRKVYGLADYFFRSTPWVGTAWARAGGVPANADNAIRLLRNQGQLVLDFPEGTKGTSKSYRDRYRLRRFGRGGFVEIAMRSGVPIVPMAVVGAEEAMPVVFRVPALAKLLKVPYFPITANMLALGPLGAVIPFPTKIKIRVLDPIHFDVPDDLDRYPKSRIMDEAERIRSLIQEALLDMLSERRSVWFG